MTLNFYNSNGSIFILPGQTPVEPPLVPVYPSQIKLFDVYYTYEPVVGIQILGHDDIEAQVSLQVVDE